MQRIFLVRHGQTPCSSRNVYCGGTCQVSLNDNGRAMAEALATAFVAHPWAGLYASALPRAREMLAPLAQQLGRQVESLAALGELDYGSWDGLTHEAMQARDPAVYAAWRTDATLTAPPGGETATSVADRVSRTLRTLAAQHAPGDILVVSHKAAIRLALCRFLGIELRHFRDRLAQPLGAINVLEIRPNGPLLRSLADLSYLPAHLQHLTGS